MWFDMYVGSYIAKKFLGALIIVGCVCIVYAGENFRLLRALLKEGWVLSPNQVESHASRLFLLLASSRWILILRQDRKIEKNKVIQGEKSIILKFV